MSIKSNVHISVSITTLATVIIQICIIVWFAADLNRRVLTLEQCKIEIVSKAEAAELRAIQLEKDFIVHNSDLMRHKR